MSQVKKTLSFLPVELPESVQPKKRTHEAAIAQKAEKKDPGSDIDTDPDSDPDSEK